MTVESATYINSLDATKPAIGDDISEGDDHIRLLKSTIQATFPNVAGAATPSHTELNLITGKTSLSALEILQNSQSADYTLVLSDSGKSIYHPSADTTARVWAIPANSAVAFPIGSAVTFVNDTSAGVLTLSITSDTLMLASSGTTGSRTLAANCIATALKITSTKWIISGSGLA